MDYVPGYTFDELRNFASTYASEYFKQNVSSIVNRVHRDVLQSAKSGKYSSITNLTSGRYTSEELDASITELVRIFPAPTSVIGAFSEFEKTITVEWN